MKKAANQSSLITDDKLYEFAIYKVNKNMHVLYAQFHHGIIDVRSWATLESFIATAYNDSKQDKPITACPALQFDALATADATYHASDDHKKDEQFWKAYVQHFKHHAYPQRNIDSFEQKTPYHCIQTICAEEREKQQQTAAILNISESNFYIAVSALWFRSIFRNEYVSLSLSTHGTHLTQEIGMTSNVVPLLLHIPEHATLTETLIQVAQKTESVLKHQRYRVEDIRQHANYGPNNSFGPYVNVLLFDHGDELEGCDCSSHFGANIDRNDLQITFWTDRPNGRLEILFDGTQECQPKEQLVAFRDLLNLILDLALSSPSTTIATFEKLWFTRHPFNVSKDIMEGTTAFAETLHQYQTISIPPNLIAVDSTMITPEMLPLITLSQTEIDALIAQVPGGLANIQDIYGLAPLQQGILFHHMMAEDGDPYLIINRLQFKDRAALQSYSSALQQVIERHDILRTAFVCEGLNEPAQVVLRHVPSLLNEINLNDDTDEPAFEQLTNRFNPRHYRLDLKQPPLLRLLAARTSEGNWIALELMHHLIGDHATLERLYTEVHAIIDGQNEQLLKPTPFRQVVAQARLGINQSEHTQFFDEMLADVDTPTLAFGLIDVHGEIIEFDEAYLKIPDALYDQLRAKARNLRVSLASLCHLAWAQVLARTSGSETVVFGTVLFGRLQSGEGNYTAMGLLINTLPLRLDMNETTVETAVRITHTRLSALLEHENASLALAQRCSGVSASLPLFNSLLNCRHASHITQPSHGVSILSSEDGTNYPLSLSVDDDDTSLILTAQVALPLESTRICAYMQQALTSLADALTHTPQQPVRQLNVVPSEEREMLLHDWNQTAVKFPPVRCLHQLFEAQVHRDGKAIAVECDGESLSYSELNAKSNRVAYYLIAKGVKPDDCVAFCVERSSKIFIAIFGILKAGAAYIPLDPIYSSQRLIKILEDANPVCLLTDIVGQKTLGAHQIPMLDLDEALPDQLSANNPDPIKLGLSSAHLAYVIYTSGSTGKPKGVMVEHQHILNLAQAISPLFGVTCESRVLQLASYSFDTSLWEILMALNEGACLCLPNNEVRQTSIALFNYLIDEKITHADIPSAMLRNLENPSVLKGLQSLSLGAETPHLSVLQSAVAYTTVFNGYGPTEATICVTIWFCPVDFSSHFIPIGRPMSNMRIYLLDAQGEPVPLGAEGEIYIGGAGVARGYLDRPDLTAERFLPDPFSENPSARIYRTGDRARYLPDGNLVFLGRTDHQLKIRGFRIEPGEIETHLVEHPLVREAVVLSWKKNPAADTRLVAYVVADEDTSLPFKLHTYLASLLPDYMVPTAYICLPSLPITPNGKLDRFSLPPPDDKAFARQSYEAPQNETEEKLAVLWSELLGIERISRHDNFFALGGHSLLIVRMLAQLRQAGLNTSVRKVFDTPSLAALAETLGQHQTISIPPNLITADSTKITPEMLPLITLSQTEIDALIAQVPGGLSNIQDIYGLAPLQQGILFHHMMAEDGDPYLIINRLQFKDRAALRSYSSALQHVIERHDILRTIFIWKKLSEPAQVVLRQVPSILTEINLNDDTDESALEQLNNQFNLYHYKLDLAHAPLMRLIAAQTPEGDWIALELTHHIIVDQNTLEKMYAEMKTIFEQLSEQLATPTPFRHVVAHARFGVSPEEHTKFFSEMLADVDTPTLPFGLSDVYGRFEIDEAHLKLPQALSHKLRAHAKNSIISLASLCHLAWAIVLAHASGCETVVFGTVLFGRLQAGEENDSAMGLVINTLPLRLDIDETTIEDAVRRTHARLSALLAHEHAPLVLAQRCSGVPATLPLFSALFNYRHNQPTGKDAITFPGTTFLDSEERTNYPLVMSVEDDSHALGLTSQVVSRISAARICAYMQQALISLADALTHTPKQSVRKLTVIPAEEREMLLHTWNKTEVTFPPVCCLHQLFEEQVDRDGQAIAVEFEGKTLSYAELNARANQLAHYLIAKGVKPDDRVASCVKRSTKMLIVMLGILKAGGAYVPLDPFYSSQRASNILNDADPLCLLADATGQKALVDHYVPVIDLDEALFDGFSVDNPNSVKLGLTPSNLAYVIYTSGSTGTPKGVMVEHQSVYNLACTVSSPLRICSESRIMMFASCAFDASIVDIVSALTSGACLCLPNEEVRQTDTDLLGYIETKEITHAHLTPALLRNTQNLSSLKGLKALILGGETPPLSLLKSAIVHTSIFNVYGPTETTIWATTWSCPVEFASHSIPIGRPLSNVRVYVLDAQGEPVPLGSEGELYIGGAGVARGYLNRPELTAERFIPDPFSEHPNARMYRTGDRACYLPDGNLVYLGRTDQQVKIRGYRIEPGEIEARLVEHPLVHDAVVLSWKNQPDTDARLVAYVVTEQDTLLAQNLRTYLAALLPDYMVPAAYVCLPSLPLTPNGKLDRRALPAPDDESFARQMYEAPQDGMEMKLATLWSELLGIVQSNGPCAIAGYSSGGILAYEITKQLINSGYPVSFLGLIDTHPTKGLSEFSETVLFLYYIALKSPFFKTLNDTVWLLRVSNLSLNEAIEEVKAKNEDLTNEDIEWEALLSKQRAHYYNICDVYNIDSLPITVNLFKATELDLVIINANDENMYEILRNDFDKSFNHRKLRWEDFHLPSLHVIPVNGTHVTMLTDPNNRSLLGRKLTDLLLAQQT
ncbi:uncharacterized protein LOC116351465 [Contarinia nasturtii]|uniref:uncharacterized protein LOC116351465 n=1 Tax=Contarinia nasturtii TaxID=265458 RepID=UPI0012D49E96|nr:uncharacterized protein LOC116351465 [Contarinia nasturtii]